MTRLIGRLTGFLTVSAIVLAACSPAGANKEAAATFPAGCDKFLGAWSAEGPNLSSSLTITREGTNYLVRRTGTLFAPDNHDTFSAKCENAELVVQATMEGNMAVISDGTLLQDGTQYRLVGQ